MLLSIRSSPVRSETSNPWSDPPPTTQAYACPASRYSPAALPLVPSPPSPRDAAAAQPTSRSAPPPSRRPAIPTPSRHPPLARPPPSPRATPFLLSLPTSAGPSFGGMSARPADHDGLRGQQLR
ncbi:hypothetical protein PVAP13_6NG089645 [Panicum virgatum]|uniref:Uncharacterized protein n=1 Tax=Panicum virgatum TaxID=38727 RepID=A0A8T0QV82_PANVG|nr:hypothetical protein PVAP13_6NG089645 [Panicum virgatum]